MGKVKRFFFDGARSKTVFDAHALKYRFVLSFFWHPGSIASMILGPGSTVGDAMVKDPRNELISFTGSTHTGRNVSKVVAERLGKSILELGCVALDFAADFLIIDRAYGVQSKFP